MFKHRLVVFCSIVTVLAILLAGCAPQQPQRPQARQQVRQQVRKLPRQQVALLSHRLVNSRLSASQLRSRRSSAATPLSRILLTTTTPAGWRS